jgi:hypothetical protein
MVWVNKTRVHKTRKTDAEKHWTAIAIACYIPETNRAAIVFAMLVHGPNCGMNISPAIHNPGAMCAIAAVQFTARRHPTLQHKPIQITAPTCECNHRQAAVLDLCGLEAEHLVGIATVSQVQGVKVAACDRLKAAAEQGVQR